MSTPKPPHSFTNGPASQSSLLPSPHFSGLDGPTIIHSAPSRSISSSPRQDEKSPATKFQEALVRGARPMSSPHQVPITARILGTDRPTRQSNKDKLHVNYIISVSLGVTGRAWRVFRRYSDFRELAEKLAIFSGGGRELPPLPAKSLTRSFKPEYLEKRQAELEEYLNALLHISYIAECPPMCQFLVGKFTVMFGEAGEEQIKHQQLLTQALAAITQMGKLQAMLNKTEETLQEVHIANGQELACVLAEKDDAEALSKHVKRELAKLKADTIGLRQEHEEMQKKIQNLEEESADKTNSIVALKTFNADLTDQIEATRALKDSEIKQCMEEKDQEIRELRDRLTSRQAQMEKELAELHQLTIAQLAQKDGEIELLKSDSVKWKDDVELLKADNIRKTHELANSQKELTDLQTAAVANATKHATKRQELDGLLEKKDDKIKELQAYLKELQESLSQNQQRSAIEGSLASMASREENDSEKAELQRRLQEGTNAFQALVQQSAEAESLRTNTIDTLNKQLEEKAAELATAQQQLERLQTDLDTLKREQASNETETRDWRSEMQAELHRVRAELASVERQAREAEAAAQSKLTDTNKQLRHAMEQRAEAERQVAVLKALTDEKQKQLVALQQGGLDSDKLIRAQFEELKTTSESEMRSLRQRFGEVEAKLRQEITTHLHTITDTQSQSQKLQSSLQTEISQLKTHKKLMETELRQELSHVQQARQHTLAELTKQQLAHKQLQSKLQQTQEEFESARSATEHSQRELASLRSSKTAIEEKLRVSVQQVTKLEASLESLGVAQQGQSEEGKATEQVLTQLRRQKDVEVAELRAEAEQLKETTQNLDKELHNAKACAESAQHKVTDLQQAYSAAQAEWEQQKAERDRTVTGLQSRLDSLSTEKAVLVALAEEKARDQAELLERMARDAQYKDQSSEAKRRAEARVLETQVAQLTSMKAQVETECAELRVRLKESQAKRLEEHDRHVEEKRRLSEKQAVQDAETNSRIRQLEEGLGIEMRKSAEVAGLKAQAGQCEFAARTAQTALEDLQTAHDALQKQKQELEAQSKAIMDSLTKSVEKTARLQQEKMAWLEKKSAVEQEGPKLTPPRATARAPPEAKAESGFFAFFGNSSAPSSPATERGITKNPSSSSGGANAQELSKLREELKKLHTREKRAQQEYDKLKKGFLVAHEQAETRQVKLTELVGQLAEATAKLERAELQVVSSLQEKAKWVADQKKLTELGQSQMAKQSELRKQLHELQERYDIISRAKHFVGMNGSGSSSDLNGTGGRETRLKQELAQREQELGELTQQLTERTASFQQEATRLAEKVRTLRMEKKVLLAEVKKNRELLSTISKLGNGATT
eukprot:gb/GEZN01000479.1/.p1 GENE.gb/GEZN01000479.1/~~gb/GEZN01000479.1/.p1  ORF type:complete len:1357 (-),score=399.31 gb/GEZN01000479.1/:119-4189(-)